MILNILEQSCSLMRTEKLTEKALLIFFLLNTVNKVIILFMC